MQDWTAHYLDRIARSAEASARSTEQAAATSRRTLRELRAIGSQVEELSAWVKRIAIALALWGSAAATTLNADQLAEIIVALLKR